MTTEEVSVGQAIGNALAFAVGVAISPIPVIAVILMLLSARARANSLAFASGWVLGVAGGVTVVILASSTIGTGTDASPSHGTSVVKIVLGALLLALARRSWRRRPAPGQPVELPRWLGAIERISPARSAGLGIALSVVNPKNLVMIVGGGLAIAGAPSASGGKIVAAVVFAAVAVSTVVVPVVAYRLLGASAERWLRDLDTWLEANHAAVMAVLLLVVGALLLGKGIAGF